MADLPRKAAARTARLAALPWVRRPERARAGQAARGRAGRGGDERHPAEDRRAAVPDPGRAQGRRDEVRPGAVGARGGAAGGDGRPLPRAPDQAAGLGTADADPDRARHPRPGPRPRLAGQAGVARRRSDRGGQHRAGAQGALARRPRRRGEGAVPRRRRRAPFRHPSARAAGEDHRPAAARHRRQGPDGRGGGPGRRRARLQARGGGPVDVRGGVSRRSRDRGARRRRLRRQGADHRVARVPRVAGLGDQGRQPAGARPLRRADGAVPVLRAGADRDAARRPAPRQLPDHPERRRLARPAGRPRLRRGGPACRSATCLA